MKLNEMIANLAKRILDGLILRRDSAKELEELTAKYKEAKELGITEATSRYLKIISDHQQNMIEGTQFINQVQEDPVFKESYEIALAEFNNLCKN